MAERDKYSKNIFDTEAADPQKEAELSDFIQVLLESAKVFQVRRQQKLERYQELLDKKHQGELGADEEEFLELIELIDEEQYYYVDVEQDEDYFINKVKIYEMYNE